jgi:hypothetical protein
MQITKIYVDRQIANVESENIQVTDLSKFIWLTLPKLSNGDAKVLAQEPMWGGKEIWAYSRPVDFVEIDGKLYYVVQMPGIMVNISDEDIKAILFPIRGTDKFIVHTYSESDTDTLEPYFSDGYFISSWEGLLVSLLEPVPESFVEIINQNYMKEI